VSNFQLKVATLLHIRKKLFFPAQHMTLTSSWLKPRSDIEPWLNLTQNWLKNQVEPGESFEPILALS
jgi:hypothetical protein